MRRKISRPDRRPLKSRGNSRPARDPAAAVLLETSDVSQVVSGQRKIRFVKEVFQVPGAEPLAVVRKRLSDQALKGRRLKAPLVLVHGFGQNRYAWHLPQRSFVNYLAREGFDVFNVDLRGHGRSHEIGSRRTPSLDEYINEDLPTVVEAVRKLTGRRRVFGLGHSLGALVTHSAAALHPDAFAGVIAIAPPFLLGRDHPSLSAMLRLLSAVSRTGALTRSRLRLPINWVGKTLHLTRHAWDSPWLPFPVRVWHPGSFDREDLVSYIARSFDGASLGTLQQLAALAASGELHSSDHQIDYHHLMESCRLPLLVIAGSEDRLVKPGAAQPAFERSSSNDKRFEIVPCGHGDILVGKQAPRTTWRLVRKWLHDRLELVDAVVRARPQRRSLSRRAASSSA